MCVVSMISDHWREKWPGPVVLPMFPESPVIPMVPEFPETAPMFPNTVPLDSIPIRIISESEWLEYHALKRKAAEYDARTNQPDCVKPDVDEWENDIEAFLILMGLLTEENELPAA